MMDALDDENRNCAVRQREILVIPAESKKRHEETNRKRTTGRTPRFRIRLEQNEAGQGLRRHHPTLCCGDGGRHKYIRQQSQS